MEIVERVPRKRFLHTDELNFAPRKSTPTRLDAFKRPTILIFEESREMQEHYKLFLKSDYNLLMVETARYGIQMLKSLPVDLIMYNVEQDREAEALGMLKVFRRIAKGAKIPVIAMTGYSVSEERNLLKKACFDAYLSRPFTLRKLRETIALCRAKKTVSILNQVDLSIFAGQTG